jgi:hypothetical protein
MHPGESTEAMKTMLSALAVPRGRMRAGSLASLTAPLILGLAAVNVPTWTARAASPEARSPYAQWTQGPSPGDSHFPIAVWVQSPARAARYREAGFNTYVGLWKGPTEEQLAALKAADMKVICAQNAVGLKHRNDSTIIGWMHGDEPDNAQSLGAGRGYGPPVPPANIVRDYERIRAADASRPVLLNLGQGVAWDRWHGRGVRTNHPEDYPEYVKGGDIISFDIYPVVHDKPEVAGKLWFVARGVERLVQWTDGKKVIWNCIECTRIQNPTTKAAPHQVRAEVWMSIIHGSMGLIYFVHEWKPGFNEAALLSDPEMLAAVTTINQQVIKLAPVLNSPTLRAGIEVRTQDPAAPVAVMAKRRGTALYLFAVGMRDAATTATFSVTGAVGAKTVEVIDENRSLQMKDNRFVDRFAPWEAHIYRIED